MNSDLIMISDAGQFGDNNNKILQRVQDSLKDAMLTKDDIKVAKKHLTMTYHTQEVLMLGFLFCKHTSVEEMSDALWALVNPEQTKYVTQEKVMAFLKKLQEIVIDMPLAIEEPKQRDEREKLDQEMVRYLKSCRDQKKLASDQTWNIIADSP